MTNSLTLFATCKPFEGTFATIQRNALRSWQTLCPPCEVLVFGNEAGVKEHCREFGFRHIPEVARSEFGTPLLGDLFRQADRLASKEFLAFVNADIILTSDLIKATDRVSRDFDNFLLIARRWNVTIHQGWDFALPDWESELRRYARTTGTLEPPYGGVDLFVYPRGLWKDLPPFAVGRTRWDSALIYQARKSKIPVVEATNEVFTVHQSHDYTHIPQGSAGVFKGPEALYNEALLGGETFIFTPLNATHVLRGNGLKIYRIFYLPYLLRKVAVWPALYPAFKPMAPVVRGLAPLWRKVRQRVHRESRDSGISRVKKGNVTYD